MDIITTTPAVSSRPSAALFAIFGPTGLAGLFGGVMGGTSAARTRRIDAGFGDPRPAGPPV